MLRRAASPPHVLRGCPASMLRAFFLCSCLRRSETHCQGNLRPEQSRQMAWHRAMQDKHSQCDREPSTSVNPSPKLRNPKPEIFEKARLKPYCQVYFTDLATEATRLHANTSTDRGSGLEDLGVEGLRELFLRLHFEKPLAWPADFKSQTGKSAQPQSNCIQHSPNPLCAQTITLASPETLRRTSRKCGAIGGPWARPGVSALTSR